MGETISSALTERLDKESDADRTFFASHPKRNYTYRQVGHYEQMFASFHGMGAECPEGFVEWFAICQIRDGVRMKIGFFASPDLPIPEEETACELFRHYLECGGSQKLYESIGGSNE